MMLGLGGCPRLCSLHNTTSSLLSQSKTLQSYQTYQPLLPFLSVNASSTSSFLSSIHRLRESQLGFRVVLGRERIGFCVSARKRRNGDGTPLDEDGIGDDGDESDDEDAFIAFPDMMRWYNNKPSGFGEGKVYDTRIEDKLLEEIKQSRVAQLANIDKLKKNPVNPNSEKANNQGQKGLSLYYVNGFCIVRCIVNPFPHFFCVENCACHSCIPISSFFLGFFANCLLRVLHLLAM